MFVAVTDYTTLHYYFVLILRVAGNADLDDDGRLMERVIYTDYVIISKKTSLGIAALEGMVNGKHVRVRKRYQIDNIMINELHEDTKRKAEKRVEWRMLS